MIDYYILAADLAILAVITYDVFFKRHGKEK